MIVIFENENAGRRPRSYFQWAPAVHTKAGNIRFGLKES